MTVQELLEQEIARALKDVKRLEKEKDLAYYSFRKAYLQLEEAELRLAEFEDALELWNEQ